MTDNLENKICTWKTNVEFQYNSQSGEEKKRLQTSPQFCQYEKCLKCSGYDDNCSKYQELKSIGVV